jgi:hypothetical protein
MGGTSGQSEGVEFEDACRDVSIGAAAGCRVVIRATTCQVPVPA